MVNACPPQSDPRPNVADFVSDKEKKALSGLTAEGLDTLIGIVVDEIGRQEPDSNIVLVDRDLLSEEDITFGRDLAAFIERKLAEGKKLNLVIAGDIPIVGWNTVIEGFKGKDIQAYYCALACRQVPLCTKIEL